jgi:hypothetical protein
MKNVIFIFSFLSLFINNLYSQEMKITWKDNYGREFSITAPSGNFSYSVLPGDNISYGGRYSNAPGKEVEIGNVIIEYGGNYSDWVEYLQEYNIGYEKMGISNVKRPYFKQLSMPIGGHCLVPNYKILSGYTNPDMLKLIDKYS